MFAINIRHGLFKSSNNVYAALIYFPVNSYLVQRNAFFALANNSKPLSSTAKLKQSLSIDASATIKSVASLLKCKIVEANDICQFVLKLRPSIANNVITDNIKLLHKQGIASAMIMERIKILAVSTVDLQLKLMYIQSMQPKDINDFVPLLMLSTKTLATIKSTCGKDSLPEGYNHRIYYFSDQLETAPYIVAKRFAENTFMLQNSFNCLDRNLKIFFEYDIKAKNLLQDIGVFRHSEVMIRKRLERVKSAGIKKVMPWMIKCLDVKLQTHIQIQYDEDAALGKHEDIKSFLAERLGMDNESVDHLLIRYPRLRSCKTRRIHTILNYLLRETDYTAQQIANAPNILFFPLETIKKRVEAFSLGTGGLPTNLTVLTQGSKRTKKLIKKLSNEDLSKKNIVKPNKIEGEKGDNK